MGFCDDRMSWERAQSWMSGKASFLTTDFGVCGLLKRQWTWMYVWLFWKTLWYFSFRNCNNILFQQDGAPPQWCVAVRHCVVTNFSWHFLIEVTHFIGHASLHISALWTILCRAVLKVMCMLILLLIIMTCITEFHIPFWWLHKIHFNIRGLSWLWLDTVCAAKGVHV